MLAQLIGLPDFSSAHWLRGIRTRRHYQLFLTADRFSGE
jgi:hypothetical protein